MAKTADQTKRKLLELPVSLYDEIERLALEHDRSVQAEIRQALRRWVGLHNE